MYDELIELLNIQQDILMDIKNQSLSYYLQSLSFGQFFYSVILPLSLILLFLIWFFNQFLKRWY